MDLPTSVTGLHTDAPQLSALAQARRTFDELFAPNYANTLALLIAHGDFEPKPWREGVTPLIERLTRALNRRTASEGHQSRETRTIGTSLLRAQAWFEEARIAVRKRARRGVPAAQHIVDLVERFGTATDNFRHTEINLIGLLDVLQQVPDLTAIGLTRDFLTTGDTIRGDLLIDHAEQVDADVGIVVASDEVQTAMEALADLMEDLNDSRELAMVRLGIELPGFDLRYIRAAVAGRNRKPKAEPPAGGSTGGATGF